jgi:hypothetical protein
MKYLVTVHLDFEPDNNTPHSEVWVKITEADPADLTSVEKAITDELMQDTGAMECYVEFIELSDNNNKLYRVDTIW